MALAALIIALIDLALFGVVAFLIYRANCYIRALWEALHDG